MRQPNRIPGLVLTRRHRPPQSQAFKRWPSARGRLGESSTVASPNDWPTLENAMEAKIEDQREFVRWRRDTVREAGKDTGRGRKLAGASGGQLIREEAEAINAERRAANLVGGVIWPVGCSRRRRDARDEHEKHARPYIANPHHKNHKRDRRNKQGEAMHVNTMAITMIAGQSTAIGCWWPGCHGHGLTR